MDSVEMSEMSEMSEIVGLCTDAEAATAVARDHGGVVLVNHPREKDSRPYSALVRLPAVAAVDALDGVADVGLYRTTTRTIKELPGTAADWPERCIATFGLIRNPAMSHAQCDAHWRDNHGPLALEMHSAMCDYLQISIDKIHSGLELDGIALCAFPTREDLSTKFFNDDDAKAAIIADVTTFSNAAGSPARVILQQHL